MNCIDRQCVYNVLAKEFFFCNKHGVEIFNPKNAGCKQSVSTSIEETNEKEVNSVQTYRWYYFTGRTLMDV